MNIRLVPLDSAGALMAIAARLEVDVIDVSPASAVAVMSHRIAVLERRARLALEVARDPDAALARVDWQSAEMWLSFQQWKAFAVHDEGSSWRSPDGRGDTRVTFVRRDARVALSSWALSTMSQWRGHHRTEVLVELLSIVDARASGEMLG